jgi:SAM-dependent methyltransferase
MEYGTVLQKSRSKAFYGLDVPDMVRDYLIIGGILAVQGVFLRWWSRKRESPLLALFRLLGSVTILFGGFSMLRGLSIVWNSLVTKLWDRDLLLDALQLHGNEHILDVGCGHGLLLIGAAKRLPAGRAVGIDLWSQIDQGSNSKEATLKNARIENVEDRVEIHDGDMRTLPFSDASFDVVMANLAIHNIESPEGRYQAAQEITRVLKPGGRIAIMDIFHIEQISACFQQCGMQEVRVSPSRYWRYPPARTITGKKL